MGDWRRQPVGAARAGRLWALADGGAGGGHEDDRGHELGTIEPGKKADLLVLGANVLESIDHLLDPSTIEMVIKDGVVAYASEGYKQHISTRGA